MWTQDGWKIGREKWGEKWHFLVFGLGEKIRKIENREENNPSEPTFFYPPNLRGKLGGKNVEWYNLHKYPYFKFFLAITLPVASFFSFLLF